MMRRRRFFVVASIVLGLAGGPWTSESAGQVVPGVHNAAQGDTIGDSTLDSAALGTGGLRSTYLNAYSLQDKGPVTGTNLAVTTSLTSGGTTTTPKSKILENPPISIKQTGPPSGPPIVTLLFTPYAALTNQPKSLIKQNGDMESIDSTAGVYEGYARQFQTSKGVCGIFA